MKCEKCGHEIIEAVGYCLKCKRKEDEKYDVKLIEIDDFSVTKNTKYNTINFGDNHFSPKFDYEHKPIDTAKELIPFMFFGGIFGSWGLVYYFLSLSKGSSPLPVLYLSLGLIFMAGLCFFIPLFFNPSVRVKCGICNINKDGLKFAYFDYKLNKKDVNPKDEVLKEIIDEPGIFKVSILGSDFMEIEIPSENISRIEIRKINNLENEYLLSGDDVYREKSYYAFYLHFVNPIYIYDVKKKRKIEKKSIRLISYLFLKSDIDKLKIEFEDVLGLTKKIGFLF